MFDSTKFTVANPYFGNLGAKSKFRAPTFFLFEICSYLSKNCLFYPQSF